MSEEGENLIYECFKCGRAFTKSEWERTGEFKCPNCGFRVARKVKPPIAKRVRTT
jgi:DNA-directed RNA polymerase subunit RPC12/RpoP